MSMLGKIGRNMGPSRSALGKRLRFLRIKGGFSERDVADELGMRRQSISLVELGRVGLSRSSPRIRQLAKFYKTNPTLLLKLKPRRKLKKKKVALDTLGGLLTARRLGLLLTTKEVAQRAKISQSTYCAIENGRYSLNSKLLNKLARALRCEIRLRPIRAKGLFTIRPR